MKKVFYPLACCLVAGVFTSCGGQKAGNAQDGQTSDKVALSYSIIESSGSRQLEFTCR